MTSRPRAGVKLIVEDREVMFRAFVGNLEPRLRRALIAAYGYERGREATAEALAYAWEHWDRVAGLINPACYLCRVGQSRTRTRRTRVVFELPVSDEPFIEPSLQSALASLSERQRVAVLLIYGADWTQGQVAELLGLAKSTVQKHAERGLSRLRRTMVSREGRNVPVEPGMKEQFVAIFDREPPAVTADEAIERASCRQHRMAPAGRIRPSLPRGTAAWAWMAVVIVLVIALVIGFNTSSSSKIPRVEHPAKRFVLPPPATSTTAIHSVPGGRNKRSPRRVRDTPLRLPQTRSIG